MVEDETGSSSRYVLLGIPRQPDPVRVAGHQIWREVGRRMSDASGFGVHGARSCRRQVTLLYSHPHPLRRRTRGRK